MDFWTDSQEDCRLQHVCILLEHANHKELLTSINNGVKTLEIAVTASKWETRCCIILQISWYSKYIPKDIHINFRKGCLPRTITSFLSLYTFWYIFRIS